VTERDTVAQLNRAAEQLSRTFLDKDEVARLLVVAALAGENLVLIGPPGTAKSAIIRTLSTLLGCRYFEYLMTRFTEPNELFGPVDILAFREGEYRRRLEGMLPEAEVVFLDEVFKANSAILNSLLTLLNERVYSHGSQTVKVPLLCLFGASNEVPSDEDLAAVFDRFLLRVYSDDLDSHHFVSLLEVGARFERERGSGRAPPKPLVNAEALRAAQRRVTQGLDVTPEFADAYKSLVFQIRNEGIHFSDRRAVKMLKLFAASAALRGATTPELADLYLLRHVWNAPGQRQLLADIVDPMLDSAAASDAGARVHARPQASIEALSRELGLVEQSVRGGKVLTDVQLFSQLKNLNDLRGALDGDERPAAVELLTRADALIEGLFASGRLSDL